MQLLPGKHWSIRHGMQSDFHYRPKCHPRRSLTWKCLKVVRRLCREEGKGGWGPYGYFTMIIRHYLTYPTNNVQYIFILMIFFSKLGNFPSLNERLTMKDKSAWIGPVGSIILILTPSWSAALSLRLSISSSISSVKGLHFFVTFELFGLNILILIDQPCMQILSMFFSFLTKSNRDLLKTCG